MSDTSFLKSYLGQFAVPLRNKAVLAQISLDMQDPEKLMIAYQVEGLSQFRQVVAACVLAYRRNISYKVAESYKDVIEVYIRGLNRESDPEDQNVVGNLSKPELLIIYVPKTTMINKQMIPLCLSVAESRQILNKRTVFIHFKPESEITTKMPAVNLGLLRCSTASSQSKSVTGADQL